MGRRVKLTPELQDTIVRYIRASNYFETACWAAGITPQTGYNWLKVGEKTKGGIYRQFYEAISKADAEAEVADVAYIKAGRENWQARAWIRERRSKDRWGRSRVEVTGKDGGPIEVETDAKGKLLGLLDRLATREGEEKSGPEVNQTGGGAPPA